MRLLHLLPIIVIISAVMAALKADAPREFGREFARTCGSLLAGFAGLAALVLILGRFL